MEVKRYVAIKITTYCYQWLCNEGRLKKKREKKSGPNKYLYDTPAIESSIFQVKKMASINFMGGTLYNDI